jgi:hypothetical protein
MIKYKILIIHCFAKKSPAKAKSYGDDISSTACGTQKIHVNKEKRNPTIFLSSRDGTFD